MVYFSYFTRSGKSGTCWSFPQGGEMKRVEVDVGAALRGFLESLRETPPDDGEPTLLVLRLPEEATGDETTKVETEGQRP